MESSQIATYQYRYGAGAACNRRIDFSRTIANDPKSLVAAFYANSNQVWEKWMTLPGDKIEVELLSTSQKTQQIMHAQQRFKNMPSFETRSIDQFAINEQDMIIQSLKPRGSRKIEILNEPGKPLERVSKITIFDPS